MNATNNAKAEGKIDRQKEQAGVRQGKRAGIPAKNKQLSRPLTPSHISVTRPRPEIDPVSVFTLDPS